MDLLTNQSQSYNFFLIKEAVLLVDLSLFFFLQKTLFLILTLLAVVEAL